jgi:uncharacterized peroxidase-related enzyme
LPPIFVGEKEYMNATAMTQPIPMVEEHEATGEVAEIYEAVKRDMQMLTVPNMVKTLAASPAALAMHWGGVQMLFAHMSIPQSLFAMIGYSVAEYSNCEYCSANGELMCRTLGIDEETLAQVARDLGNVKPQRVQAIIQFALKVAHEPLALTNEDFDKVRAQGVSDEDIVEIIVITARAVAADIMADALKVPVERATYEALGR